MEFKNKNVSIFLILILLLAGISFSGCLGHTDEPTNYTNCETVSYEGNIYLIGNANNVTLEDLNPDVYYLFYINSYNSDDGCYFINGKGQVFENLEHNYDNFPIELTPYALDIGAFDWPTWIYLRDVEEFTYYGTVSYEGNIYLIGNANTITLEDLNPDVFYPFFKNNYNSADGYYYINGEGQVFENLEHNYDDNPIELTPYALDIGAFDWPTWIYLRDRGEL